MGVGFFSRLPLVGGFFQREYRILVIGLDNSGKTTLLDLIKQRVDPNTNSVGFALEVVFVKKTVLNVWDVCKILLCFFLILIDYHSPSFLLTIIISSLPSSSFL
eukprot:TRINITY_DN227_c0_g1_i15.p2 TRINITY_DN227_c0_g1~~TRINITY_DN227_c0_g1_i15.p2  ORF type:complete len:104 (+),score=16.37 TRINITY_DN227_c0_g1_i15:503-814(+)